MGLLVNALIFKQAGLILLSFASNAATVGRC